MAERLQLSGWGGTPRSVSNVRQPDEVDSITFEPSVGGNLARGLGRSYGDAALNAGGLVWDTTRLTNLEIDTSEGVATAGPGVSYAQLLDASVPRGWFPPATPGTKQVTIGGAVAADIHGKNHHRDGSLRRHVLRLTVLSGDGETREVNPGHELFEATFGGMGLTGLILQAEIRLLPISSPSMLVETTRTKDLSSTLKELKAADRQHRYTVAWLDLASGGAKMGRGIISAGDHSEMVAPDERWHSSTAKTSIPAAMPDGLINSTTVRLFNELWYRKAPHHTVARESIESFFYPLDAIGNWNRLYGRRGFIQYQFVVPEAAQDSLPRIMQVLRTGGEPLALAVLKRFGPGAGLLSFPAPGWTLAVDIPARVGSLAAALDRVDWMVAEAGGRVYLAKDGRMHPGVLRAMYPELDKWRSIADRYDPERRLGSDLDRRLGLRAD